MLRLISLFCAAACLNITGSGLPRAEITEINCPGPRKHTHTLPFAEICCSLLIVHQERPFVTAAVQAHLPLAFPRRPLVCVLCLCNSLLFFIASNACACAGHSPSSAARTRDFVEFSFAMLMLSVFVILM